MDFLSSNFREFEKIFFHIKPQQIWRHFQTSNIKKVDEREISFSIISFCISQRQRESFSWDEISQLRYAFI